jgi:uncharacterized protein (DUF305 family)
MKFKKFLLFLLVTGLTLLILIIPINYFARLNNGQRLNFQVTRNSKDHLTRPDQQLIASKITNDKIFINYLIQYSQQTINYLERLTSRTANGEISQFANEFVLLLENNNQQLEQWYNQWFDRQYEPENSFSNIYLTSNQVNQQDDQEKFYIQSMQQNLQEIIWMTNKINFVTENQVLKEFARDLIEVISKKLEQISIWSN